MRGCERGRPGFSRWLKLRRYSRRLCMLGSIVAGSLSTASPGAAQGGGSYRCLRGAPQPECRGFLRIEVRGGGAMGESPQYHFVGTEGPDGEFHPLDSIPWFDTGDWLGAEVGYALNVSQRWAVGLSVALETGNETLRLLARGRLRRWASSRIYAEVLGGVYRQRRDLLRSGDELEVNYGFNTELRLGLSGVAFVSARSDLLRAGAVMAPLSTPGRYRLDPGGTAHAFSIGGGLEGRTAILASSAVLLIGGAALPIGGLPAT